MRPFFHKGLVAMHKICRLCGTQFGPGKHKPNFSRAVYCSPGCAREDRKETLEKSWKKFWSFVDKGPHPKGCWLWTSYRNEKGYGLIHFVGKKNLRAHRLLYEHVNGPLDPDVFCLHKCDVRHCVNPDHMFLGSYEENMADCMAKGRHAWGEKSRRNKINLADAKAILARKPTKARLRNGLAAELAADFKISTGSVYAIWAGRTWTGLQVEHPCE